MGARILRRYDVIKCNEDRYSFLTTLLAISQKRNAEADLHDNREDGLKETLEEARRKRFFDPCGTVTVAKDIMRRHTGTYQDIYEIGRACTLLSDSLLRVCSMRCWLSVPVETSV